MVSPLLLSIVVLAPVHPDATEAWLDEMIHSEEQPDEEVPAAEETVPSQAQPAVTPAPQVVPVAKPKKPAPRLIGVELGVGMATTRADDRNAAYGFMGEVQYIWAPTPWLKPRVYAGTIITGKGSCSGVEPCDVQNVLFYGGGLVHAMIPFPYFGPFLEVGLGLSGGAINTVVGEDNDDERHGGAFPHLKIGVGAAIGPNHGFELGVGYMQHFTTDSFAGGLLIGAAFPI